LPAVIYLFKWLLAFFLLTFWKKELTMAFLTVGNTWDYSLLRLISSLNMEYTETKVITDTLFGNTTINPIGNARTTNRLQDLSMEQTQEFIEEAHKLGIRVAWTINVSCVGNTAEFVNWIMSNKKWLRNFFSELNPDILIIANPLVMLTLTEIGIDIPIEISTIANISEPNQIAYLISLGCNITRVCLPVHQNRNIEFLSSMGRFGKTHGIEMEVIANEFCFLDKCNCEGVFRRSCYDMNAHATEKGEVDNVFSFPRKLCTEARLRDPVNWLRAKWILPQMMPQYEDLGIHHFKITGRTHPTAFLANILPHYYSRLFHGNLLELWPHIQTIGKKNFQETQKETISNAPFINTKGLDWFTQHILSKCKNDCSSCSFCQIAYAKLRKEGYVS
jgi:collagenase-like PrtC family protease